MKLKDGFLLHTVGGENLMIATGDAAEIFSGLVRENETGMFILRCLQKDTTEDAIVDAMAEEYDAPRGQIAADVHRFLSELQENHFLDM